MRKGWVSTCIRSPLIPSGQNVQIAALCCYGIISVNFMCSFKLSKRCAWEVRLPSYALSLGVHLEGSMGHWTIAEEAAICPRNFEL